MKRLGVTTFVVVGVCFALWGISKAYLSDKKALNVLTESIESPKQIDEKGVNVTSSTPSYLLDSEGSTRPILQENLALNESKKDIRAIKDLVEKIKLGGDVAREEMDELSYRIFHDGNISRSEKIDLFKNFIDPEYSGLSGYFVDILDMLYPYEAAEDLANLYYSTNSTRLKSMTMEVLKGTKLAPTQGAINLSEEMVENYKHSISVVKDVYRNALTDSDPEIRKLAFLDMPSVLDHDEVANALQNPADYGLELSNADQAASWAQISFSDPGSIDVRSEQLLEHLRQVDPGSAEAAQVDFIMSNVVRHYQENLSVMSAESRQALVSAYVNFEPGNEVVQSPQGQAQYRMWLTAYLGLSGGGTAGATPILDLLHSRASEEKRTIIGEFYY